MTSFVRSGPSGFTSLIAFFACVMSLSHSADATVISSSPTLPVLDVAYVSPLEIGCFPLAGVCLDAGALILAAPVSSSFNASGQDITTAASYTGILSDLAHHPIGSVDLIGTVEQEVLGRTFSTELGTWTTQLVALSLSGPVLGHTATVTLDSTHESVGTTSISALGGASPQLFAIDSAFDAFLDISLDTPVPLHTTRGPVHVALAPAAVSEPSSSTLIGFALGLLALPGLRRQLRRTQGE